jgi:hypothetical protein
MCAEIAKSPLKWAILEAIPVFSADTRLAGSFA